MGTYVCVCSCLYVRDVDGSKEGGWGYEANAQLGKFTPGPLGESAAFSMRGIWQSSVCAVKCVSIVWK